MLKSERGRISAKYNTVLAWSPAHDDHSASRNAFQTRRPLLYGKLVAIVEAAQRRDEIGMRFSATDIARLFIGVYLSESREWVQRDDADLPSGLGQLRTLLSISIDGMLLGNGTGNPKLR
jgi:hypothetical protein